MTDMPDPRATRASDWLNRDDDAPAFVLIGVPASAGTVEGPETWETPAAVRRVLQRFTTYDAESGVDLADLRVADWGDWLVAHLRLQDSLALVRTSTSALPGRPTYAFIGGEALVTLPVATNLPHAAPERTGVLLLGSRRRAVAPLDRPTAASLTRSLVAAGIPGDHIVHIGTQPFADTAEEAAWCDDHAVRAASTAMIERYGVARVVEEALDYLEPVVDTVHVSIDLGVLDRSHAPAAPSARPGGLTPRQLREAARACGSRVSVRSVDLVDVDVGRDTADVTVMNLVAALLAFASGVAAR